MREISMTWGGAAKVTWSLGWRLAVYLIPAYVLGVATLIVAMMAGDSLQGPVIWGVIAYYVLHILWVAAVVLAFVIAVKNVIGRSYSASSFPSVPEGFRIALVSDA